MEIKKSKKSILLGLYKNIKIRLGVGIKIKGYLKIYSLFISIGSETLLENCEFIGENQIGRNNEILNTSITNSKINDNSKLINSKLINSTIFDPSEILNSTILISEIYQKTHITNSKLCTVNVFNSLICDSEIFYTEIFSNCLINNSKVEKSKIHSSCHIKKSNISYGIINKGSLISNSNIYDSIIGEFSDVNNNTEIKESIIPECSLISKTKVSNGVELITVSYKNIMIKECFDGSFKIRIKNKTKNAEFILHDKKFINNISYIDDNEKTTMENLINLIHNFRENLR